MTRSQEMMKLVDKLEVDRLNNKAAKQLYDSGEFTLKEFNKSTEKYFKTRQKLQDIADSLDEKSIGHEHMGYFDLHDPLR